MIPETACLYFVFTFQDALVSCLDSCPQLPTGRSNWVHCYGNDEIKSITGVLLGPHFMGSSHTAQQ